jgi:hypothetical protein
MLGLNGAPVALGENLKPPSGARPVVTFLLLFALDFPFAARSAARNFMAR